MAEHSNRPRPVAVLDEVAKTQVIDAGEFRIEITHHCDSVKGTSHDLSAYPLSDADKEKPEYVVYAMNLKGSELINISEAIRAAVHASCAFSNAEDVVDILARQAAPQAPAAPQEETAKTPPVPTPPKSTPAAAGK